MANLDLLLKDLTNKDEKKAVEAARYIIDNSDEKGLFNKRQNRYIGVEY